MPEFPEGFDLGALLAPISEETPAGTDLRQDTSPGSLYHRLRDARAEARAGERPNDSGSTEAGFPPQWRVIRDLAIEALSHRSKDLEIAAWLTEALFRSDGLVGLAAGFRVMAGLTDGFWEGFFPQPDEDGVNGRLASVAGLNGVGGEGTLIQPMRRLRLFPRPDGSPFELWHYERSKNLAGISDAKQREQRIKAGAVPFETFENEARAVDKALFAQLRRRAVETADAWQVLGKTLEQHAGTDAPPTSQVREVLEQIQEMAGRFAPPPEPEAPVQAVPVQDIASSPKEAELPAAQGGPGTVAGGAVTPQGGFTSREDALRVLAQIAEFFQRTEPHSPLAYTLKDAVRRGRMTWPELLEEMVPDAGSRSAIMSSLGIRPPPTG
jgi:type VI secretion system protein ImpA